jgi:hypothetical protein
MQLTCRRAITSHASKEQGSLGFVPRGGRTVSATLNDGANPIVRSPISPKPDDFFDKEDGFLPKVMGEHVSAQNPVLVGEGGRLYRYLGGVYRPDAEEWIAAQVRDLLGIRFKRRHQVETIAWFRASISVDTTQPPTEFLNVENGLLRWDCRKLEDHRQDVITTIQLPVRWNPDATCPAILGFLRDVLPDEETVNFVLEIIGYALIRRESVSQSRHAPWSGSKRQK